MRTRIGAVLVVFLLAACEGETVEAPPATVEPSSPVPARTTAPTPAPSTAASLGTVPPAWLGQRQLPRTANGLGEIRPTPAELRDRRFTLPDHLEPLPGDGFASRVEPVPNDVLARSSWSDECPVDADDLQWVRLAFWGFDGRRHTGELLLHADAADEMVQVFSRLYAARFPIEEMRITRAEEIDAEPTGDGNNTGAFTCRPVHGTTYWAQHAYGLAVDVNPFQNPYIKPPGAKGVPGDMLIPELAAAYLDRSRQVPGMIRPGDTVVQAFASVGWQWGGNWQKARDFMHFSANGR
jgi:hypothetical protein